MKISVIPQCGRLRIITAVFLLWLSNLVSLHSQPVTIDFTTTSPIWLSTSLPWHEDGFTVASLTQVNPPQFPGNSNPRVMVGSKLSPQGGYLEFLSANSNIVTALITNDAWRPFDLQSLDVIGLNLDATNYARITSSTGGTYDLFGTLAGATLSFTGPQWANLSYLLIEFQAPLFRPVPILDRLTMQLDNIVLRSVIVPEPAGLGLSVLACLGVIRWRKWRRGPRARILTRC